MAKYTRRKHTRHVNGKSVTVREAEVTSVGAGKTYIPTAQANADVKVADKTLKVADNISSNIRLAEGKGLSSMVSFGQQKKFSTPRLSGPLPPVVGEPKTNPKYSRDSTEFARFSALMDNGGRKLPDEQRALKIAEFAHFGQTDQLGAAYLHHPNGVRELMMQLPEYDALSEDDKRDARIAAQLHDVLEDTAVNADDLRKWGVTEKQMKAIDAVTSRKGEAKPDYYNRVLAAGPVATCVKLGDLSHNNLPERRENLAGSPSNPVSEGELDRWSKLGKKYYVAYTALGSTPPPHLQQFKP